MSHAAKSEGNGIDNSLIFQVLCQQQYSDRYIALFGIHAADIASLSDQQHEIYTSVSWRYGHTHAAILARCN